MGQGGLLIFSLIFLSLAVGGASRSEYATVVVGVKAATAETRDEFVCATIDWWPPEKCDFGQCPWGLASALNLNLSNPILYKAIKAFNPLRIRIGGSLQDQVVFETPNSPCRPFKKINGGLFGFSEGCLPRSRWDELNLFFKDTGAVVTYGLNALSGRWPIGGGAWGGPWNSSNSFELMSYTLLKGYPVDSWEFGNELSGSGIGARVGVEQYARDTIELKAIIDKIYRPPLPKPLLVAPGGFFDKDWYTKFLQLTGPNVVDGVSHHVYNLGAGNDPKLVERILDGKYLDGAGNAFKDLKQTLESYGPWSSPWISEAGGSYTSGGRLISDTFVNGLWYLDQMGQAARHNTKVYCRQSLMGGNYGLIDRDTFIPNPDFYGALLWHRLMGKKVLNVDFSGSSSLRVYAHCTKDQAKVSMLFLNLDKEAEFIVHVRNDLKVVIAEGNAIQKETPFVRGIKRVLSRLGRVIYEDSPRREEYHMSGDGDIRSKSVRLNGNKLEVSIDGKIPTMDPLLVPHSSPVFVDPLSFVFVVFPNLKANTCN